MIQDILQDIIKYVHGVGVFSAVRVIQTKDGIEMISMDDAKTVVLNASSSLKFSADETVFGIGKLDTLQKLLDCPEYEENATVAMHKGSDGSFDQIEFANASGDFTNNYRLMSLGFINSTIPEKRFLGAKWDVEFPPSAASVQRFNLQASANSGENSFTIKTIKDKLEVSLGSPTDNNGRFVFANGITGKLNGSLPYSTPVFQKILNLTTQSASSTIKIAESRGTLCVTLDSGLVNYNYYLMGLSK